MIIFYPPKISIRYMELFLFIDWETEVHRGKGICPSTHCELVLETDFLKIEV